MPRLQLNIINGQSFQVWQTSSVLNKERDHLLLIDANCELKWCVCSISTDTKQEKHVAVHKR